MEILKQVPKRADAVFSCVGGGGLLAGVGTYVKQLSESTQVVGVETYDANALTQSLEAKERKLLNEVGLFADGAAVRIPGKNCFSLCLRVVDKMINVTTDDICQAIKLIFNDTRIIVEPAGALGVAGLIKYAQLTDVKGQNLVAIISGANMDFDRLRFVSERADRSESLIHVKIPEIKGAFLELYKVIYPRNVTEFSYRMKDSPEADIILSFQAKSAEDKAKVLADLNEKGFATTDFSNNEIAKTHVRHLAAGRYDADNERLLSFEFPEGPGALNKFLQKLHQSDRPRFNVSLFHYRNHGDDVGRVLVGVQVPATEENAFADFLSSVDLVYTEETSNPAYLHFLRNTPTKE